MTLRMTTHTVIAVIGSYGVTWFFVQSFGRLLNSWVAMSRSESVLTATMTGFVVYLILVISAFAIKSTARLLIVVLFLFIAAYLTSVASLTTGA